MDKRSDRFARINMDDHHRPPTEDEIRRVAAPLLEFLYHYPETVTPWILRKIADYQGKKKADVIGFHKRAAELEKAEAESEAP